MLKEEISKILSRSVCGSEETYNKYIQRLKEDNYTRDEDPQSHFCVFFLPYDPNSKKVFIIHHKKSGFWIAPGGHIDKGENILQTLNREINEELGLTNAFKETPAPFLFTIHLIENKVQPCKTHYDIWYLLETDGADFKVDPAEFLDTKWMTVGEARRIVTVTENLEALAIVEKL